eukprot:253639_1
MAQDPNDAASANPDAPQQPEAAAASSEQTQGQPPAKGNKLTETMEMLSKEAKKVGAKAEEYAKQAKDAADQRLSVEGQLKAAKESLKKFLNPKLDVEKQIPIQLMKGAKGIVFLSSLKASIGFGGAIGTGVMLAKLIDNTGWSGPCSIGLAGAQVGFNIGAQKTDFIIILRDESALKLFSGKGQIKFGADASIAAGPLGRDVQLAVGANDKGYAATMSYSMAQGLYVGFALEGQGIVPRDDCNERFYGKKLEVKDILTTAMPKIDNEDYGEIVALVDSYAEIESSDANEVNEGNAQEEEQKQPL